MSGISVPQVALFAMGDIDLEQLADGYRHRPMSESARQRAIVSADGSKGWLLDIGGGTGGHAATWVAAGRRPVVVDPASRMAARGREMREVEVVQGRAQALPFADNSVDLAYFHLSIHYGEWPRAVEESLRVTRPGGRVEIWTMAPSAIQRSSLGEWFPKVVEIDAARFPEPQQIAEFCTSRNGTVQMYDVQEVIERPAGEWMQAVQDRFVSTLQLLSDDEIAEGITRFRAAHPDVGALYRSHLTLTRISIVV